MRSVEWRPRAQLDRTSILIYIAVERQAPKIAEEVLSQIDAAIARIAEFPDIGRRVSYQGLRGRNYRRIPAGHYLIFYRVDGDVITIVRVLHERQDYANYTMIDMGDADSGE